MACVLWAALHFTLEGATVFLSAVLAQLGTLGASLLDLPVTDTNVDRTYGLCV